METNFIVPGMVIVCKDNCRPFSSNNLDRPSTHPYLVISMNNNNKELGYAQCMKITSMKNKEHKNEIPFLLGDSITFIVPYNIHSFPLRVLSMDSYKGFVSPGIMSSEKFLDLLMRVYHCNIISDLATTSDEYVKETFLMLKDYQNKFFEKYKDYKFYRDKVIENFNEFDDEISSELIQKKFVSVPSTSIIKVNESVKIDDNGHIDAVVEPDNKCGLTIKSLDDGRYKVVNCNGDTVTTTRKEIVYIGNYSGYNFLLETATGEVYVTDGYGNKKNWSGDYPKFVEEAIEHYKGEQLKELKAFNEDEFKELIEFLDSCPRKIVSWSDNQLAAAFKIFTSCTDVQIASYSERWNSSTAVKTFRINLYGRIKANPFTMEFNNKNRRFLLKIPTCEIRTYQNKKEIKTIESLLPSELKETINICKEFFPQ